MLNDAMENYLILRLQVVTSSLTLKNYFVVV
jgi:hypothetical protein